MNPKPPSASAMAGQLRASAPPVDRGEEEQPYDVHKVPIPGRRFETEVTVLGEMALGRTPPADGQEDGSNQHMEAVESRRHEEGGRIDAVFEGKGGMRIFKNLAAGEQCTQRHG